MALSEAAPRRWLIPSLFQTREADEQLARSNQFLMQALEDEKREGHWIAVVARTVALGIIAVMLPFLNPNWDVLYYEALLMTFVAVGWLQWRFARVGSSRPELALIFFDLALLTLICVAPNPFRADAIPGAFLYRFDNFGYFFLLLALATLAYSWRTVFSIGTWVAALWIVGIGYVHFFGARFPELSQKATDAFAGYPTVARMMDPNAVEFPMRVQEIVLFFLVATILALKGWRTNRLLVAQAEVAAERANLSRYFPNKLVSLLASSRHDIGAVRSQNAAVLFADIVGFTKIAESNPPEKVMDLLRRYHAVIEQAIFDNGGTLDKYLGDGVMASFGTPEPGPDDAANALRAGWRIIADMEKASRQMAADGHPHFSVSVGIHFGPVIIGDIGPSRRLEFAVIGDTVNVANRLESVTRELGCRLVASNALIEAIGNTAPEGRLLKEQLALHPSVQLRGRANPIDVWAGGVADHSVHETA